jgi:hypothetical protein
MVDPMVTRKKPTSARLESRPKGRPKGIEKVRVILKLPPELDTAIYEAAGKLGLTKSAYVEGAVRARLERDNAG